MELTPEMRQERDKLLGDARGARYALNEAVVSFNAATSRSFEVVSHCEGDYEVAMNALDAFAVRVAAPETWDPDKDDCDEDFLAEWDDFGTEVVYREEPRPMQEESNEDIEAFVNKPLSTRQMKWHTYEHDYRVYEGERRGEQRKCHVMVRYTRNDSDSMTEVLDLHLAIVNHSPTGFEWGYEGSGPAQLALAIIADLLRKPENMKRIRDADPAAEGREVSIPFYAERLHQPFKRALISFIMTDTWAFDERSLMSILVMLVRNLD